MNGRLLAPQLCWLLFVLGSVWAVSQAAAEASPTLQWQPLSPLRADQQWVHYAVPQDTQSLALQASTATSPCWLSNGSGLAVACQLGLLDGGRLLIENLTTDVRRLHLGAADQTALAPPPLALRQPQRRALAPNKPLQVPGVSAQLTDQRGRQTTWTSLQALTALELPSADGRPIAVELRLNQSNLRSTRQRVLLQIREAAGPVRWEALEFTPAAGTWLLDQQPVALSRTQSLELPAGAKITLTSSHSLLLRSVTGPAPLLWSTNARHLEFDKSRTAKSTQRSSAAFAPATKELTLLPSGTQRTLNVPYQPFRIASAVSTDQMLAKRAVQRLINRPRSATLSDIPAGAQRDLPIPPASGQMSSSAGIPGTTLMNERPRLTVLAPLSQSSPQYPPSAGGSVLPFRQSPREHAREFALRPAASCDGASSSAQQRAPGTILLRLDPALRDPVTAHRTRLPVRDATRGTAPLTTAPALATAQLRILAPCSALRLVAPRDQAIRLGFTLQQPAITRLQEAHWLWLRQLPLDLRRQHLDTLGLAAKPRSSGTALSPAEAVLLSATRPALELTFDRLRRWTKGFTERSRLQVPNLHCSTATADALANPPQPALRDGALWSLFDAVQQTSGAACRNAHQRLTAALTQQRPSSDRTAYWRALIRDSQDPALARWARSALDNYLARNDRPAQRRELLAWWLTQSNSPEAVATLSTVLFEQGLVSDALNLQLLVDDAPQSEPFTRALVRRDWLTALRHTQRRTAVTTSEVTGSDADPVKPLAVSASRFTQLQNRLGQSTNLQAVATRSQPVEFEVQGPVSGSLMLRQGQPEHESHWVDVRTLNEAGVEHRPVLLPSTPSRRWRDKNGQPVGGSTSIPLRLGSGRHRLRIEPRSSTGQLLAEIKLLADRAPNDLTELALPEGLSLAGTTGSALPAAVSEHPLSAARAEIARLADRHAQPLALATALSLVQAYPDDPRIGRYGRWLQAHSHWTPWQLATTTAGQRIVRLDRYTPSSPAARQRALFLAPYAPGSLRLTADDPVHLKLNLAQPQTLRVTINHLSRYRGAGPAAGYGMEINGRQERPSYLSRGADDTLLLALAAGSQSISLSALALPPGSELRLKLAALDPERHWQPIIETTQQRFQVPATKDPGTATGVDFAMVGPAWVRIDELRGAVLSSRELLLTAGQRLPIIEAPADTVLRAYRRVPGSNQSLPFETRPFEMPEPIQLKSVRTPTMAALPPPAPRDRLEAGDSSLTRSAANAVPRWQPTSPATYTFALGIEEAVAPEEDETVSRRWLQQVSRRNRDEQSGRVQEIRLQRTYGIQGFSMAADDDDQLQLRGTLWTPRAGYFSTRSRIDLRHSGRSLSGGLDLRLRHDRRFGTVRTRTELGLFGYLANTAAEDDQPLLTWSDYRNRHRSGLDLRQRLTWQPYADAELFAEVSLRSNEVQQHSIERGSAAIGLRTQLGRLQFGGAVAHRHYFADSDRRTALALTRLQLQARWYALQRRSGHLELRPRLEIDSRSRELQSALTLTWHFDRRQGTRDYHGDQLWFTRLLERSLTRSERDQ